MISVIGVLAAPWIADLLTRGVDEPLKASQQQDLSTLLLRFFIPQVMLYAIGAVAVAVLYAKRHLTVTAIAPVGTSVSLRTTAFAATIAPDRTTTRWSTIDPLPIKTPDSIVHPSRWTMWPTTQSSSEDL